MLEITDLRFLPMDYISLEELALSPTALRRVYHGDNRSSLLISV